MKWMLSLILGLSCMGGVTCATDNINSVYKYDRRWLGKLLEACKAGNINQVAEIINNIKNLNSEAGIRESALIIVACCGYEDIVKMLLEYGVNANGDICFFANKPTALIIAARNGHEKIVEMLVQYGADINMQGDNGVTALMIAAEKGYEKIVKVLLDHKVDANKFLIYSKTTALIVAAQNGHEKIVEMLLQYDVEVNAQRKDGATALIIAVKKGHEKIVGLLLERRGVDANVQAENGATALMQAIANGDEKIVKMLLRHGVNANIQAQDGCTALMGAVGKGNKEIVELLIEHGAYTGLKLKEKNRTASDVLDNLSDYGISLEDEKIQNLKYILNSARVLDKLGLNYALIHYPDAKEMLVKKALMLINKVYKEDLAIRDVNDQQAQSNALLISNLLRVKKSKIKSIQDNHADILGEVYKDEYFKQQAIEAGHFAEYKSKKYVFNNLSKAIKNQRFSDLAIYTQDNF